MRIEGYRGTKIDMIRILALGAILSGRDVPGRIDSLSTGTYFRFPILRQGMCGGEQAGSIIRFWNELSDDQMARCHNPGFALQLLLGSEPVFTAALCWDCNNISFAGRLAPTSLRAFDGRSEAAVQLLRLCKKVTGSPD